MKDKTHTYSVFLIEIKRAKMFASVYVEKLRLTLGIDNITFAGKNRLDDLPYLVTFLLLQACVI